MNRIKRLYTFLLFAGMLGTTTYEIDAQSCLELIWFDEFENSELDTNLWNYDIGDGCPDLCGWGNNEQQYYSDSPENIKVQDGRLIITAREDSLGGLSYSSSKITTQRKGNFKYGRFEARMKLPTTQGMWPAFWMLSSQNVYGEWPRSGEMDIAEMIGSMPGQAVGSVHTGMPYVYKSGYYNLPMGETFADSFHIFAMEWEPDSITWFVDGNKYHQLTPNDISPWSPFQEDFYIILNLAVGGEWPGPVDASTVLPQTLDVDYVRVYSKPENFPIIGEQPIMEAAGLKYSTYDVSGANYIWDVPLDATIVSGQGTHEITLDWGCTPENISLEIQTACDTVSLLYDVDSFMDPTISGPQTVIESQIGNTYMIQQEGMGDFMWQVPNGATISSGQGSNQIIVDWGCGSGEVLVAYSSSCGITFHDTLSVALPIYAITGRTSVLPNSTNLEYSIGSIAGATYEWSVPVNANILSGQGTPSIQVDIGDEDGVIRVKVSSSCGTNTYDLAYVISNSFLYVDFENTDLEFIGHSGGKFKKVDNPSPSGMNTSENVGRVNKEIDAEHWAGVNADVFEIPLDDMPILSLKVFSSSTGIVQFRLDDESTGSDLIKIRLDYNPDDANKWVNLFYDFTGELPDIYDQFLLCFDHGSTDTSYWYFDCLLYTSPSPRD